MKSLMKKVTAMVLAIAMVLSLVMVSGNEAAAGSSYSYVLDKSSVHGAVGDLVSVNLAKNSTYKAKWSIGNKKIASLSVKGDDSVVLELKKSGKTTLTCKVDGKKLTCTVYVNKKYSQTKLADNVTYSTPKKVNSDTFKITVNNKNSVAVSVRYNIDMKDSSKETITTVQDYLTIGAKTKKTFYIHSQDLINFPQITKLKLNKGACMVEVMDSYIKPGSFEANAYVETLNTNIIQVEGTLTNKKKGSYSVKYTILVKNKDGKIIASESGESWVAYVTSDRVTSISTWIKLDGVGNQYDKSELSVSISYRYLSR